MASELRSYADHGITIPPGKVSGQVYTICPKCSHERKAENRRAKCLSVQLDKELWFCSNCERTGSLAHGWAGDAKPSSPIEPIKKVQRKFYDEQPWNWQIKDSIINPEPKDDEHGEYDITWYYRDVEGRLAAAKKMHYNYNGVFKRDHTRPPLFLHTRDSGYIPCLFNEHDLTTFPKATVILVEAEKTAALLRHKFLPYLDSFIFLATGGTHGLSDEKCPVLSGRKILVCFDCDQGDIQPDGSVKNPRGRENGLQAVSKLKDIAKPKFIDIDPTRTDGTDLADIIDELDIEYFTKLDRMVPEKLKAQWKDIILVEKPPYREPLLMIDNLRVLTPGNHSMILGPMKSRKSLFLTHLIYLAVSQKRVKLNEIQYFDTEQSDDDVWELREKIYKLTGAYPNVFMLRGCSHKERLEIIDQTIDHWETPPRWVIVDGIRDLMSNINNEDESNKLITWIQKRTYRQDLHMTEVLHMNKTDGNARGHIGTELLNRTEITISLELDKDPTFTNVKCLHTRRQPFSPFMIRHGAAPDFLPEVVGSVIGSAPVSMIDQRVKVTQMFEHGPLKYKEMVSQIEDVFGIGEKKARHLLTVFKERGWIAQFGKPRHPDTVYKLMVAVPVPHPPEPAQLEIKPEPITAATEDELPF